MIYLASQSARRREILKKMKVRFRVIHSTYHEAPTRSQKPAKLALRYARGKVRHAVAPKKARFVMGMDTVVWCRKKILGKPKSRRSAQAMLRRLSGGWHEVYTAVVLWDRKKDLKCEAVEKTRVLIRKLSKSDIQKYIDAIDPYDKAGGYAIQAGPRIVKRIVGSYSNVVGLPRERVRKLLRKIL